MGVLSLIPIVLFLGFMAGFAWVGYEMYLYSHQLADRGKKHLEKKNIVYTKDGVKFNVKDRSEEELTDKSQSVLHKTINLATSPDSPDGATKSSSRNSSSRPAVSRTSTGVSSK